MFKMQISNQVDSQNLRKNITTTKPHILKKMS